MTTTTLYQGHDGKSSSRVLRPPGGGSSNIFGTEDQAPHSHQQQQQQERQQQQREAVADTNQNQAGGAAAGHAPQPQQANKNKREDAPFATFAESGKMSNPSQFDNCANESQNDADFRSYSVTAYRDAVAQNAATKQRARGQAAGAFNPITHEEKEADYSPYAEYEQKRPHPQQVQQQSRPAERPHRAQARVPQYNPITGEEYPASYGQNESSEKEPAAEDKKDAESPVEDGGDLTTTPEEKPQQPDTEEPAAAGPQVKKPSTRVRQPPGGVSSGLW